MLYVKVFSGNSNFGSNKARSSDVCIRYSILTFRRHSLGRRVHLPRSLGAIDGDGDPENDGGPSWPLDKTGSAKPGSWSTVEQIGTLGTQIRGFSSRRGRCVPAVGAIVGEGPFSSKPQWASGPGRAEIRARDCSGFAAGLSIPRAAQPVAAFAAPVLLIWCPPFFPNLLFVERPVALVACLHECMSHWKECHVSSVWGRRAGRRWRRGRVGPSDEKGAGDSAIFCKVRQTRELRQPRRRLTNVVGRGDRTKPRSQTSV